jgi:hypothetical protein
LPLEEGSYSVLSDKEEAVQVVSSVKANHRDADRETLSELTPIGKNDIV